MELADVPKLSNNLKYKEEIVSPSEKDIQPVSVSHQFTVITILPFILTLILRGNANTSKEVMKNEHLNSSQWVTTKVL